MTRLLVIMGSGETSPTMVKTHREVFGRLGPGQVPAALLDTPFGFQQNADEISAKAADYFRLSVGRTVEVASFRRADRSDPVQREASLARIRQARWLFAGPGSPTYALRQWIGTDIPGLLADKLRFGGVITFASAAALTLGLLTVPVYEIYKVGADPVWAGGLDLLAEAGLRAAVIPHYDNAEGGTHDTRFCYLGEPRLRIMEDQLPDDAFVLGVDEHTGCLIDLDSHTAAVVGLGHVTVRRHGRSSVVPAGSSMSIGALEDLAMEKGPARTAGAEALPPPPPRQVASPLLATIRGQQKAFDAAVTARDAEAAVRAILELDDALVAWSADTLQSDEQDRGRAALRGMIAQLGELAKLGVRDPREMLRPYVSALLELRASARAARRFQDADHIRDRLLALGVDVQDTPHGTDWDLNGHG